MPRYRCCERLARNAHRFFVQAAEQMPNHEIARLVFRLALFAVVPGVVAGPDSPSESSSACLDSRH